MTSPQVTGVQHVKIPVNDLARSRTWYETTLGVRITKEFTDDDGVVRGVATVLPHAPDTAPVVVALRQNPDVAGGLEGFDPLSLSVADRQALSVWARHFEATDTRYRTLSEDVIAVEDPDGVEIRFFAV